MMKIKILIGLLSFSSLVTAQIDANVYGGFSASYLQFPLFQKFVESYNQEQALYDGLSQDLEFNQIGYGGEFGIQGSVSNFVFGFGGSQTKTMASKATFKIGDTRGFQFKSYTFDMIVGFSIGEDKFQLIPYLDFGTQALQIHSWLEYDGVKSYGSEGRYNGVWTSWRLMGAGGLKFHYNFSDFVGMYADFNFPINLKTGAKGSTFTHSDNTTSGEYFFPLVAGPGVFETDLALPQNYRNMRFSIGMIFQLNAF